jgi:surfactin synthase thioesterase subunit
VPFTVITGYDEDMTRDDVLLWQKESTFDVDFKQLPGGHFFIHQYSSRLIELFSKKILIEINKHSSHERTEIFP